MLRYKKLKSGTTFTKRTQMLIRARTIGTHAKKQPYKKDNTTFNSQKKKTKAERLVRTLPQTQKDHTVTEFSSSAVRRKPCQWIIIFRWYEMPLDQSQPSLSLRFHWVILQSKTRLEKRKKENNGSKSMPQIEKNVSVKFVSFELYICIYIDLKNNKIN